MPAKKRTVTSPSAEKILWVENDPMHIEHYSNALRDHSYAVLIAVNITDAIQMIKKHTDIKVVILDVMLPISSQEQEQFSLGASGGSKAGIALGRWIRDNYPEIKLFGCSVSIDKKIAKWFETYGIGFALQQSFLDESDFVRYFQRRLMEEQQIKDLRAFIVHGHDEKEKYALKNYLQNTLGLPEPIILHENPSSGRTIIEKFEQLSEDIDVVFVLLTPDDQVFSGTSSRIQLRARQNVIFELGYFLGKLQRKNGRVILLYKGDLELPTDLSGLIYINIDHGIESEGEQIRKELLAI
jgi:CheY-like chemotaxis protein